MNKVNPFHGLMAPTPLVTITPCLPITFFSNLSNTGKAALVANLDKTYSSIVIEGARTKLVLFLSVY